MVFEAVVVELLNKFLKQYIENLDTSQLKLGIWGGDVVLKDLQIKARIFDDLNLPVRVKWGKLGKLEMKIPWKNLYSSNVVINIYGLLVVIVPNVEVKYDPVKEEKWLQEKKQAKLKAIEEAKKQELEGGKVIDTLSALSNVSQPVGHVFFTKYFGGQEETSKQSDGFLEKLLTQITKNLQITISDIHIRYEDKTTIPGSPYSVGVTLSNLSAQTTLNDPTDTYSKLLQDNVQFICKVCNLEGLSIYWNSSSVLFSDLPSKDLTNALVECIPRGDYKPKGFMYMFGPLSASAFLRLNPKPELDGTRFQVPKLFAKVDLKEIELAVTHNQFRDAMAYIEEYHRFMTAGKYRKYRPVGVPVIGHAKEWWRFAYLSILEDITRRRREWTWENIKAHTAMCKNYFELFKGKLNGRKLTPIEEKDLASLEKKLNVFNLVLIRERVYVEVERVKETVKEQKSGSWFGGWFSFGGDPKAESSDGELVKKIESVMTPQEKQKLYKAIGYEESAPPTTYPITFVEAQFWLHLDEIKTTVYDDRTGQPVPVMTISVRSVKMELEKRPMFAIKLVMIIGNFIVIGKQEKDNSYPELVSCNCKESESLIEFLYETKPLSSSCDQRIHVNARPLRIIYHAATINLVREVFKTESSEEMDRIVAATSASLPNFQKMTALGLQYAIEKRAVLEVKIYIQSSYLIIPYGGVYNEDKDMLVLMMGKLTVETEEADKEVSLKKMALKGTTNEEIFSTFVSASYTTFNINLTGVQVLFQLKGEDWVEASKMPKSILQFLQPTNLQVTFKKSLVLDDARIPKAVVEGKLPSLAFNFSEERFVSFVALVSSIPMETEKHKTGKLKRYASIWSVQSLSTQLENKFLSKQRELATVKEFPKYEQGINLVCHFEMNEFTVNVIKTKTLEEEQGKKVKETASPAPEKKFLNLRLVKLEVDITSKTFEKVHVLKLGGIDFKQYYNKEWFPVVSTRGLQHDYYLFVLEHIYLDPRIPDFYSARGAVINRVTLNITPLNVLLEKEILLAQLKFVATVQRRVDAIRENTEGHLADAGKEKEIIYEEASDDKKLLSKGKRFRRKTFRKDVIDFFVQLSLDEIKVRIAFQQKGLAEFDLQGCSVDLSNRMHYSTMDVNLRKVSLEDLNPQTKHPKIMKSLEKQTIASRVTIYNKEFFGSEDCLDMSVEAEIGGVEITFVALFFSRILEYLSAFQAQVETLKQSATIAAQKAKENVVKAFHNSAEVCLKIKMNAPLITIPRASYLLDALAINLGVLTIKNSILELDYALEEEITSKPLIDTVKVNLQNLKVTRYDFNEENVKFEKICLVPVTFELNVKRNLSTAWFNQIPSFEILARLASVRVNLSHDDLCAFLGIMRQNLDEGAQANPPAHSKDHSQQRPTSKHKEFTASNFGEINEKELINMQSDFSTTVKFLFFMDSFIFDVVNVNPQKDNEETGLARFVLEAMSLKGRMFTNNALHISIRLVNCLLEDTRPEMDGKLTRLFETTVDTRAVYSKTEGTSVNSMFEIIYQKKDRDAFVDIRVYKFTLILSMDFLQKLGKFFHMEEKEMVVQPVKAIDKISGIKDAEKSEALHERPPTLTFNLRLEKPDIIIVANMDSINTDALVCHTEMVIKYRIAGLKKVVNGTMCDIELYSCCFNPERRPQTMTQVIKPFTVSVAGSTPEGTGLHIDVCLTDINIIINPATVDLITKCSEALLRDSSSEKKHAEEVVYDDLWDVTQFKKDDYWFLKPEEGVDVLKDSRGSVTSLYSSFSCEEILLLAIPSITILLEGMSTNRPQPLILLEMGFQMRCCNWSYRMSIYNTLTVKLGYHNAELATWEPIFEPIEKFSETTRKSVYIPWELYCSIVYGDEGELEELRPPSVQITVSCSDVLQLMVTKTCIDVLSAVWEKYFTDLTKHQLTRVTNLPPYVIKNETGLVAELLLEDSKLQVCKSLSEEYKVVRLDSCSEVELQNVVSHHRFSNVSLSEVKKDTRLFVMFPTSGDVVFELPLGVATKRYYPFFRRDVTKEEIWGLVSEVTIIDNSTIVVLRSCFQIKNYFNKPINIHSLTDDGKVAEYIGTVEGNSSFYLPFDILYRTYKKLFVSVQGYSLSTTDFDWTDLKDESELYELLQCNYKEQEDGDPFFIQAVGEKENIYYGNTKYKTSQSMIFTLHLQPTVKIHNSLVVPLVVCPQGRVDEKHLTPGNSVEISNVEPGITTITLRISDYLEKEWSCKETIVEEPPEFFIWKFISYNGLAPETLNLGVHVTFKNKTAIYTIYSPYIMINKTQHLLSYKFENSSTVFYHPGNMKLPVMFSPTSKKFFSKKSAYLQVKQSNWSDKFPVDVAGSGGTIECKQMKPEMVYKISITISLTYSGLTKMIVFTPYYVFVNSMKESVEYQECAFSKEHWSEIPAGSCIPFWPMSEANHNTIHLRFKGSNAVTPPFAYHSTDVFLLRLNHMRGGIHVNIKANQSGTYITMSSYKPGLAPALIINHSNQVIKLHEQKTNYSFTLKPFEQVMHAWTCPMGSRRLILLNSKQPKTVIQLNQDTDGLAFNSKGDGIRYVSFLDGTQRVLLFTEDPGLSKSISNIKLTTSGLELICKIQGIGVSLVNNITQVEILYMGIVSSGTTWEAKKVGKGRFKQMKDDLAFELENAYEDYLDELETNQVVNPIVEVPDKFKVNFEKMELIQPMVRELRRTHEPGLWLAYRKIEEQIMLHVKINRIQIDSQLMDSIFQVILAPVPPPKTVSMTYKGPKPFVEMSLVKITDVKKDVTQYKYFKILIQEFHVKMDIGFLQQIYNFMATGEMSDEQHKAAFQKDLQFTARPLKSYVEIASYNERKNFYDLLHFSPIKIHFSFSLAGKVETEKLPSSLSVMLQSLGVTLTDAHDVIFRLSYFEREGIFLTKRELIDEVRTHYYGQIIRQAYVLLLGLDVIGNPYGLIVGIGQGVEAFFYEPFQGIIQGPSEFGRGMALGWKSLVGHTVGSAAGTLGKLTETLGKGLAVLSLDKEYQMQRMTEQSHHDTIQASMAKGGRNLVMGLLEGVSGIVQKPVKGAKEEGVGGFFKGVGKGMMGLVTRPVTGIVDFASTSLNAVKRVTGNNVEVKRLRPPRFFRDDSKVEPYCLKDAQGYFIFYSISKRKYVPTDKYEYHLFLKEKEVVVLTNKRILLVEYSDVFGTWQEHMAIMWKSMPGRPRQHTKGVALTMPYRPGANKDKPDIKVLLIEEKPLVEEACKRMVELYQLETEDKQLEELGIHSRTDDK